MSQLEILLWVHSISLTKCWDTAILWAPPICHFTTHLPLHFWVLQIMWISCILGILDFSLSSFTFSAWIGNRVSAISSCNCHKSMILAPMQHFIINWWRDQLYFQNPLPTPIMDGDDLVLIEKRDALKQAYSQLQSYHPSLPSTLKDFQVFCCEKDSWTGDCMW